MSADAYKADILFVDDEKHLRSAARQTFELAGLTVECFASALQALEYVTRDFKGIIVSDIRMPELDGFAFLDRVLEIDYELPVVLITGHGDIQMAVDAMRRGAYDFIEKPFAPHHLTEIIRRAIDKRRLTLENRALRSNLTKRDDLEMQMAGRTDIMVSLRKRIRAIAPTETDVLIIGETGTGKEVAARALHALSDRAQQPFVVLNCGSLPSHQIESELFGHEAGAFPGALRARSGKFEHARGGTVFLDEIESMSLDLQLKLLRVFEDRAITRLGSHHPITLDVRFIAASKIDLERAVQQGHFRSDLYYRLTGITLRIPTLAERRDDIPRLFIQLANQAALRYRRNFAEIQPEHLADLVARNWPGNVRELRNAADRFVLGLGLIDTCEPAGEHKTGTLSERMASYEKSLITAELVARKGVIKQTYQALGLSRKSLYEKMQRYGLDRSAFKNDVTNDTTLDQNG